MPRPGRGPGIPSTDLPGVPSTPGRVPGTPSANTPTLPLPGNTLPGRPGRDGVTPSIPTPGRGDVGRGPNGRPGIPGVTPGSLPGGIPGRDGGPGRDRGPGLSDNIARDPGSRPVKQLRIDPKLRLDNLVQDPKVAGGLPDLRRVRDENDLRQAFDRLRTNDAVRSNPQLAALNLDRVSGRFQTRIRDNDFAPLVQSRIGRQYDLDRQFNLYRRGDVTRQLNLNTTLVANGGWGRRRSGPIFAGYTGSSFSVWYPGPRWYPRWAWQPIWSPWVSWSFWPTVLPIYDPRPFYCRPYFYDPCPPIVVYDYPVWQPLPIVTAGTWVDVPPVVVPAEDLQLLAVRFVDPGHVTEKLGPRFRVWLRNNSKTEIRQPFDVSLFATNTQQLADNVQQSGVTIPEIAPEATVSVDIRLPFEANAMNRDTDGSPMPFEFLHAVVDSRGALPEADKANNGAVLNRGEIYSVDPAAFSTDVTAAAPGTVVSLAGEGFGPEPGQLIVTVGDQQLSAEIRGWYDLGVQFTVPNVGGNSAADAQVLVIRGDGASSNPVPLSVAPEGMIGTLPTPPAPMPPGPEIR